MKVKFANAEVDVWKVRQGAVVLAGGHIGHIKRIGFTKNPCFGEDVFCIDVETTDCEHCTMSDSVTWLEPH